MLIFWSGIVLLCGFAALDFFVRVRMKRAGYKWVFLRGATLNYNDYLRLARANGWAAWPLFLLLAMLVSGLVLVFVGFAIYGARP
jgi:hypothetical protein